MKYIIEEKKYKSFKREEFVEYFSSIGSEIEDSVFIGDGWKVSIGKEVIEDRWKMKFPVVKLDFEIREDVYKNFADKLRMAFLRGGA